MPARVLRIGACAFVIAACRARDDSAATGGRVVLERNGRVLVDGPAAAARCPADSTLAVAVVGREWAAAFSVRAPWPTDSARIVPAGQTLGPGTAVVALRPLSDSLAIALVSARGSLTIEPGPQLAGSFDVMAPTTPGAPDSARLTARFTRIAVTDDLCAAPAIP
jgi:hypothetical protein